MAQIKTKLLGDIELNVIQNKDGGEFIPHQELSRFIYDEMFGKVSVEQNVIPAESGVLATCKMTDVTTGRSVVGIGESSPTAMESDYEKTHRAYSAANRAFDNAAFLFLGIDRSTLSRGEGQPENRTHAEAPVEASEPAPAPAPAAPAPARTSGSNNQQVIDAENPFDTVITGGKFKGRTFRDVAENEPAYAQWVVEKSKMSQEVKDLFAALLQG